MWEFFAQRRGPVWVYWLAIFDKILYNMCLYEYVLIWGLFAQRREPGWVYQLGIFDNILYNTK